MRAFAATLFTGFVFLGFAEGAELSTAVAPEAVLRLANAYVAALPEQEKEGHQNDIRDMFVDAFFWGFISNGGLTSGTPADFAGDAAGRQYRLSNPDKLEETMQGFGYVVTNAVGTWSRGFELSKFRTEGDAGRGWWLRLMLGPSASTNATSEFPPNGGEVRIAGFLSRRGEYGHLGMCDHQFFATNISLVRSGQPSGAASRSQPIHLGSNETSGAAGSGR